MATARIVYEFTRDEINAKIPYAMICETRYGSAWNTSKRRRLWATMFTEAERREVSKLFALSHTWYLVKGVPDTVEIDSRDLALWLKLAEFCGNL